MGEAVVGTEELLRKLKLRRSLCCNSETNRISPKMVKYESETRVSAPGEVHTVASRYTSAIRARHTSHGEEGVPSGQERQNAAMILD